MVKFTTKFRQSTLSIKYGLKDFISASTSRLIYYFSCYSYLQSARFAFRSPSLSLSPGCVGKNKNKFYRNMAYLWVAFCYVRRQQGGQKRRKTSEKKERSVLCNHITSSIFNLNKILFITIAGNNCEA